MLSFLLSGCRQLLFHLIDRIELWARESARPVTSLLAGALADRVRSRSELIAENQLLRQQLIQVRRQIGRPKLRRWDRLLLVIQASRVETWASAILIVKPETILRWHRLGFRLPWKRKSQPKGREPPCWPFSSSGAEHRQKQSLGASGARTFDIEESGSDHGSCLEELLISSDDAHDASSLTSSNVPELQPGEQIPSQTGQNVYDFPTGGLNPI